MHSYNLIVKAGRIDDMDAMINGELTRRFGPDVHYNFRDKLTQEAIVIVRHESKRTLQSVLGDWFAEEAANEAPYPEGTLLHYREILPGEGLVR